MTSTMINYLIKDELPKVPILLYSLKNKITFTNEVDDLINTKKELLALNESFWMSDLVNCSDIVIPFDMIKLGKKHKFYLD